MPDENLDFEEPIAVLQKEIKALRMLPRTPEREEELERLSGRVADVRREIFSNLTPWQNVLIARHPNRPHTLDYIEELFTEFTEIHGDRRFGDDAAIVAGFANLDREPVLLVGHQKGRGTRENIKRNFGYAKPEGYRKALRAMKLAEKFGRPIVVFIDTPAAYPGIESEERGVAEAIAYNLREMTMLTVPVIVLVIGEGGSGGALGIAIGDTVLMQEYAIYSVIPPEGCAAILWRDGQKKVEAAEALKIQANDLMEMGIIDKIIPEPLGGAHVDQASAARILKPRLKEALRDSTALSAEDRLELRYQRFREIGHRGLSEGDSPGPPPVPN